MVWGSQVGTRLWPCTQGGQGWKGHRQGDSMWVSLYCHVSGAAVSLIAMFGCRQGLGGHLCHVWTWCVHPDSAPVHTINVGREQTVLFTLLPSLLGVCVCWGEGKQLHSPCSHSHWQCLGGMLTVALASISGTGESSHSNPAIWWLHLNPPAYGLLCPGEVSLHSGISAICLSTAGLHWAWGSITMSPSLLMFFK